MSADEGRQRLIDSLARVADGDRGALKSFYESTSAKLFGVVLRILNDRGEAEEVLQEVYLTIWRKAPEFDASRASPVTWAATIARNRAIDRIRARGRAHMQPLEAAAEVSDPSPTADALLEASDEARRIHAALGTIEPRYAAAIRSAFFEGLTYEQLAAREGVPLGTMKSWIRRGLMGMKTQLGALSNA